MRLATLALLLVAAGWVSAAEPRPNILIIMADDMGFSDIGCYGSEIPTPNIDRLAREGVRFTQFYNNAKCEHTRASLLTGMYAQQVGASPNVHYRGPTIAEVLRPAGYRTLMTGKWHAGQLPVHRGFDRYYGLTDGCCNYFNPGLPRPGEAKPAEKNFPRKWAIDDKPIRPFTPKDPDFYTTDAFTDYALKYLDQYANEDKPFLLYVAYTAPHYPLHARPEDIARFRGKYKAIGWDKLRKQRYQRQLELGLFTSDVALSRRDPSVPAWDSLSEAEQDAFDHRMAVYAAMIYRMDHNIGRILDKLEAQGELDNTLVLFLSDNGAEPADVDYSVEKGAAPGPVESYRMQHKNWANASNTPFRRYKTLMHEGGISTPLIARWPGTIAPGTITRQPGHLIDLMATCIDLSGASFPASFNGKPTAPPEGRSLRPILEGKQREPHEQLCWKFRNRKAIRQGDWKLVSSGKRWELYNLAEDRTELHDLSKQHPERVSTMAEAFVAWEARCQETYRVKARR